jgi:hypothetical protein
VAAGLVHVQVAGRTGAIRIGEALVAVADRSGDWRNIGQTEAILFRIVESACQRRRATGEPRCVMSRRSTQRAHGAGASQSLPSQRVAIHAVQVARTPGYARLGAK